MMKSIWQKITFKSQWSNLTVWNLIKQKTVNEQPKESLKSLYIELYLFLKDYFVCFFAYLYDHLCGRAVMACFKYVSQSSLFLLFKALLLFELMESYF